MIGDERLETLEAHPRANEIPQAAPRDRACLRQEEREVLGRRLLRRRLFGEAEHALPIAALLAAQVAQVLEGAFVRRVVAHGLLEPARAYFEVAVARAPAHAKRERRLSTRVPIGQLCDDRGLHLLQLFAAPRVDEEPLVERRDLLRARVRRVGGVHEPLELVRGEATRDARGAQEHAGFRSGRELRRRANQVRDVGLPRPALDLHVLEARARERCARAALRCAEALRVRGRRAVVVAGVAKHVAELEQQLGAARALERLELELEELLHHVQLAEIPVDGARAREALRHRRIQLERVLEVLQGLHPEQEFVLEQEPEPQMAARLLLVRSRRSALLELLDKPLPIPNVLEMRKTLLKVH